MAEKSVSFCPQCGSQDVEPDLSTPAAAAIGGSGQWRCNRCNFTAKMFPEVPEAELPEPTPLDQVPERSQVDTTYGQGSAAWMKYAGLIITPILGFLLLFTEMQQKALVAGWFFLPLLYLTFYLHNKDHNWVRESRIVRYLAIAAVIVLVGGPVIFGVLFSIFP